MKTSIFGLMLALVLSGCGGGGATPAVTAQVAQATPTPGATTPTSAPSSSPSTVPAGNHIAAAPAQVFTSSGVRKPQSVNLGTGGVPTIVVGYSPTMGATFSQLYTWAATAQNVPVQESGLTNTTLGPLTLQTPILDNSNAFALTYFDWIISPAVLSGTGKIGITVAFSDGTTGSVPYYSYDKWNLSCGIGTPATPSSWGYVGGVPKGQVLPQDVIIDCVHLTIDFPNGAALLKSPSADAYGNLATQMTTILSGSLGASPVSSVALASLPVGSIYLVKLSDGGFAKFMLISGDSSAAPTIFGFSLHDSPSGSGNFAF